MTMTNETTVTRKAYLKIAANALAFLFFLALTLAIVFICLALLYKALTEPSNRISALIMGIFLSLFAIFGLIPETKVQMVKRVKHVIQLMK